MFDSKKIGCALALIVGGLTANSAQAHFYLLTPENFVEQTPAMAPFGGGDPQKTGPCGPGEQESVTPSGKVAEYHAGETVHVTWEATVDHNGYFRISLAENPDDFIEPPLNNGACEVDMASIQTGPHDNVLMDGIGADVNSPVSATMQDVVLPDAPCEDCTLQVLMFMSNHQPPCVYYHCAKIRILPKDGSGTDGGVSGDGGAGGSGAGGSAAGAGGTGSGGGGATSMASGGKGGSSGGSAGTTSTASGGSSASTGSGGVLASGSGGAGVPVDTGSKEDDGGCAVVRGGAASEQPRVLTSLLGLGLAALYLRRRRR